MTEHIPSQPEDFAPPPPPKRRRWLRVVIPIVTGLVGILIGTAAQPPADPEVRTETVTETETVEVPGAAPADELAALEQREADVKAREEAVAAAEETVAGREAAVTETEDQAAANSFGDGTHMVGSDIMPGTYRAPGGEYCYWERLSGTSGEFDDIITNDLGDSQHVVTIAESDVAFSTDGCGTWERQ